MLIFLNTAFLALASATIIPIIIYLFVVKKPQKIVFSSLKHVKASQKRQKKKITLRNILLLIIRCLIILTMILAISRPAIRGNFFHRWSRHSQTAVAIVLDTSYSMDYLVDTRTELEIGKEIVKKVSDMLTDKDIVFLFTYDEQWNNLYSNSFYGEIPDYLLASINITASPLPVSDVIKQANNKLKQSHLLNREIYVITDFREQNYPSDNDIPVFLIPTSMEDGRVNISAQNTRIIEDFVQKQLTRSIAFDVVNHSNYSQQDVICQLMVNGRVLSEKVTDLEPLQKKTEHFDISIDEPGWYSGYVAVRNERLPFDTRNYFSFYYPEESKVAIISNQANTSSPLNTILEIYTGSRNAIKLFTDDNINYEQLSDYEFVIVDTEMPLTPRIRFVLERLSADKKGILHLVGSRVDENWKSFYQDKYRLEILSYNDSVEQRVNYFNKYHPITEIIKEDDIGTVSISAFTSSRYRGEGTILASTENNSLMIEHNRSVFWLFDVWSLENRFLIDPLFPVIAYRTFRYCSYSDYPSYKVGERVSLPDNKIVLPNGEMVTTSEPFYTLNDKGVYEIPISAKSVNKVAVNIDYEPSNYRRIESVETEKLTTLDDKWNENILRSRYGFEIWKYLFMLAILLVASEMLIVKKEENKN